MDELQNVVGSKVGTTVSPNVSYTEHMYDHEPDDPALNAARTHAPAPIYREFQLREKLAKRLEHKQNAVKHTHSTFKPTVHTQVKRVQEDMTSKPALKAMIPRCFGITPDSAAATSTTEAGPQCDAWDCDLLDLWYEDLENEERAAKAQEEKVQETLAHSAKMGLSDIVNFDLPDLPEFEAMEAGLKNTSDSKLFDLITEAPDWETFAQSILEDK